MLLLVAPFLVVFALLDEPNDLVKVCDNDQGVGSHGGLDAEVGAGPREVVLHLDQDFECDEFTDDVCDCVLGEAVEEVCHFAENVHVRHQKSKQECASWMLEFSMVIDYVFHHRDAVSNLVYGSEM